MTSPRGGAALSDMPSLLLLSAPRRFPISARPPAESRAAARWLREADWTAMLGRLGVNGRPRRATPRLPISSQCGDVTGARPLSLENVEVEELRTVDHP